MLHLLTLTWKAKDKLTALKKSLMPALKDIPYKWYIKDNLSEDGTVEEASSWGDTVKVFPYKDNKQNFSEGMNYLFNETSAADEDYVLLLNNDVTFNDTTSIKNMIDIMEKDNTVGVVGCRLLYTGTDRLQHAGVVINNRHGMPMHFRANEKSDANAEQNREFQTVTGAVLLTKAKYYKNVCENPSGNKGMSENFRWAFDDIDFCLSVKYNLNKKIIYCGKTNVFHEESASLKKNPTNKLFMNHNVSYFKEKWVRRAIPDQLNYSNPSYNLYKVK